MARIKFIVTGDMEKSALHKSLQRFFPNIRDSDEVIWDTPRKARHPSFTGLHFMQFLAL